MKKSWISAILAVIAFMAVYVALCYMVPGWRLKLEAPAMVYFAASLRHMALLKGLAAMAAAGRPPAGRAGERSSPRWRSHRACGRTGILQGPAKKAAPDGTAVIWGW